MLLLGISGCGQEQQSSKYTVVETFYQEEFSVAFRQGDKICDVVTAALQVLAAEGKVSEISHQWFREDITTLEGDAQALANLGYEAEQRIFIMGLDPYSPPMSFIGDDGEYAGFDVELASAVCEKLGWEIKYQSINPEDADIELSSGNVDAAWGGMSFSIEKAFSLSPVYMTNEKVLVSKSDSGIKKIKDVEGKRLGVKSENELEQIKAYDESMSEMPGSVKVYLGTDRLIFALDEDLCDLIITDSLAVEYYY